MMKPMEAPVDASVASSIAERIAARRRERGLSQRALADLLGMDQSAVSRIESGDRRVSVDELSRIAQALDTNVGALLGKPATGSRLAAAEWLVVHHGNDSALVRRLRELLELSDLVARVLQMDPPAVPSAIDPPLSVPPSQQGTWLAGLVREKEGIEGRPLLDLPALSDSFFGVDVAREPVPSGERGALVQCGTGMDRVLLALINSDAHPAEQRACLARLLCVANCRDVELLTIDPLTGEGSDAELAEVADRAANFAQALLLPIQALEIIDPPARKAAYGEGPDAVDAAVWAVAKLAVIYLVPPSLARELLITEKWLTQSTVDAVAALSDEELIARAGLVEQWRALAEGEYGIVAPPQRIGDSALGAYEHGVLGIGTLAELWHTDPKTMYEQVTAAGYRPHYEGSAFDDRAPTREELANRRTEAASRS